MHRGHSESAVLARASPYTIAVSPHPEADSCTRSMFVRFSNVRLARSQMFDEDSWLLAKCASQDRTIGQLADTLTERSNTNLVHSVFERSLFAHAIGQKPRSQPFDDDDRWLLAKRASWDRAFESEPRSRSIFVRFSKARFQLARLARRRLFGVGSRLVTERVCRNLTKTERMYVYKIPPLGSWLGEHKSVIIIYIFFCRIVRKQYHTLYKKWSTPKKITHI